METEQIVIEVIKIIISSLTPIVVLVIGLKINRKIEQSKSTLLKEKEWQSKWAELYLNQAIEFNTNISIAVCSLFQLQDKNIKQTAIDEIIGRLTKCIMDIQTADWESQNFAQFATKNGKTANEKQKRLIEAIRKLIDNKKGDLEAVRQLQFEYNQAVRKAHNEILNSALEENKERENHTTPTPLQSN